MTRESVELDRPRSCEAADWSLLEGERLSNPTTQRWNASALLLREDGVVWPVLHLREVKRVRFEVSMGAKGGGGRDQG